MPVPTITDLYHGKFSRGVPYKNNFLFVKAGLTCTPGTDNALFIERISWAAEKTFGVTTPIVLSPVAPAIGGLEIADLMTLYSISRDVHCPVHGADEPLIGWIAFDPPIILRDSATETFVISTDPACVVTDDLFITVEGWLISEADLGNL
jgi:hypothetical protein